MYPGEKGDGLRVQGSRLDMKDGQKYPHQADAVCTFSSSNWLLIHTNYQQRWLISCWLLPSPTPGPMMRGKVLFAPVDMSIPQNSGNGLPK